MCVRVCVCLFRYFKAFETVDNFPTNHINDTGYVIAEAIKVSIFY